ncbi:unnamed protein product [Penicillium roqueforti FM164]|uniref:Genomic scaffold, ProqFM164S01 n=1 Tax=Penicillium roqueforti (strain FM164) TaxID=1365484 RepID=W6PZ08_PENRF|nr:unnamed protein product [Penicillium roqueforti FM164]
MSSPEVGFRYSNNNSSDMIDRPYHSGLILDTHDGLGLSKSGRSTGLTSSVLYSLESVELDRLKSKQGHGYHFVINWLGMSRVRNPQHFAEAGDYGAWIARVDGMVFGMLTGGNQRQGTTYFCQMTAPLSSFESFRRGLMGA